LADLLVEYHANGDISAQLTDINNAIIKMTESIAAAAAAI